MRAKKMAQWSVCGLVFLASGCTTYYRITDPVTKRVYYTTDYDRTDSGALAFQDEKSRANVTLQTSEVMEVSRQEFEAKMRE